MLIRFANLLGWLARWFVGWPVQQVWRFAVVPLWDYVLRPVAEPLWRTVVTPIVWRAVLRPILVVIIDYVLKPIGYVLRAVVRGVSRSLSAVGRVIERIFVTAENLVYHMYGYLTRTCGPRLERLWKYWLRPILRAIVTIVKQFKPIFRLMARVLQIVLNLVRWIVNLGGRILKTTVRYVWTTFFAPVLSVLRRYYARRTRKGFTQGNFTLGIKPGKLVDANGGIYISLN